LGESGLTKKDDKEKGKDFFFPFASAYIIWKPFGHKHKGIAIFQDFHLSPDGWHGWHFSRLQL
jgi:hypothetical protein